VHITDNLGRARHSERAIVCLAKFGAHGATVLICKLEIRVFKEAVGDADSVGFEQFPNELAANAYSRIILA
jgi:hypothetical protein